MNWDQIARHPYFTIKDGDEVPLQFAFGSNMVVDDGEEAPMIMKDKKIWINTKNSKRFMEFYQKAMKNYLSKTENDISAQCDLVV